MTTAASIETPTVEQDLKEYFRLLDQKRDGALRDDIDLCRVENRLRKRVGAQDATLRRAGGWDDTLRIA